MTNKTLSQYFQLQRRYSRSINLERDLESVTALDGYILTKRADVQEQIKDIQDKQGTIIKKLMN
ncbi:hypothetical protein H6F32_17515 [Anabaena sp. FACHB-1237]|uniref:hypothetical protein n=1 Tax=Anabaena sp. FACHB-1237 TaxID=2692769 RepID=UPI001680DA21|nr:hypothetical protein [Anabaena sp. FACHB-1237]MBD2139325.1 hypothetical protein [Anabaena sp. FACHB-1237]